LVLLSQGPHAPLEFTVSAPKSAHVGQPVPIVLRLANVSDRPVEAHFLGRTIAFDIVVTKQDGAVVWQRLGEKTGQSILQIRTLAAGEQMEWRDDWIPKRVGHYRVQGVLPSDTPEPRRTDWVEIDVR
jgi:intracellular proteinase inhibitor BsuPI